MPARRQVEAAREIRSRKSVSTWKMLLIMATCAAGGAWAGLEVQDLVYGAFLSSPPVAAQAPSAPAAKPGNFSF